MIVPVGVFALQLHGECGGDAGPAAAAALRPPRWRARKDQPPDALPGTGELLRSLRYETWAGALRPGSLYHFVTSEAQCKTRKKPPPKPPMSLPGMLFAAA